MRRLEDNHVVIVLLALVLVITSGKEVTLLVKGTWLVSEDEMIFRKFGDPTRLSLIQLLWESEISEVLMIRPNFYVLGSTHEVMVPFREGKHDSE